MAVLLGLAAALAYGASDFLAGLLARRFSVLQVATVGHVAATLGVFAALPLTSPAFAPVESLAWGAAAGAGSAFGALALYRGLGRGQMSVVAPLSGLGAAALPAAAGFLFGERPSPVTGAGIALALPAVWLVSTPRSGSPAGPVGTTPAHPAGVVDGVLSGVGFALLFVGLDRAGGASGLWPVAASQLTAVLLLAVTALVTGGSPRPSRRLVAGAATVGALGGGATVLYFLAAGTSLVAVAAVLTSLYPAATVVLARLVLGERFSRTQAVGLGLVSAAVVLIVAG